MTVAGIDFGTTAVRLAVETARGIEPVAAPGGGDELAAVVCFADAGRPRLGATALARCVSDPAETVRGVKRLLGRPAGDSAAAYLAPRGALPLGRAPDGGVAIEVSGRTVRPETVAALLVGELLDAHASTTGLRPAAAVVGTPPDPDGSRGEALRAAMAEAGLDSVRLVPEALAVASAFCRVHGRPRVVAVVDLGASATSVAVVRAGGGEVPRQLALSSEEVGGDDVDLALVRLAVGELGLGALPAGALELLRQTCEGLKRDLSVAPETSAPLPPLPGTRGGEQLHFASAQLDGPLSIVLEAVDRCWARCLREAGMAAAELAAVHLVGGMAQAPPIEARVRALAGQRPRSWRRPGSAVAAGAVRLADALGLGPALAEAEPGRPPRRTLAPSATSYSSRPERRSVPPAGDRASRAARPPQPSSAPAAAPPPRRSSPAPARPSSPPTAAGPGGRPSVVPESAIRAADLLDAARAAAAARKARLSRPAGEGEVASTEPLAPRAGGPTRAPGAGPASPAEAAPPSAEAAPVGEGGEPATPAGPRADRAAPEAGEARADHTPEPSAGHARPAAPPPFPPPADHQATTPPPEGATPSWPYGPPDQAGSDPPPSQPFAPAEDGGPRGSAPSGYPPGSPAPWSHPWPGEPGAGRPAPGFPLPAGPGRPATASPSAVTETAFVPRSGTFRNPREPAGLLAMGLGAPLTEADLESIALPALLLRVAGHREFTGTLALESPGPGRVEMRVVIGRPLLTKQERARLLLLFDQDEGRFELSPAELGAVREKPGAMLPLVVEGLRNVIRGFEAEAIGQALGPRYDLAPLIGARQQMLASRLGLPAIESRIVQFAFDGKRSGREMVAQAGTVKRTTAQVMLLLTLFDMLEYVERAEADLHDLAAELATRAARMRGQDHFEALQLHWSATTEEVEEAHARLVEELAPGGPLDRANPEACRAMRKRAREAHGELRDDDRRQSYRQQIHPTLNYAAVKEFLQKKAQAMSMRADQRPVEQVRKVLRDIGGTGSKKS